MVTKSKTITVRFSIEELEGIKAYMKKYKCKSLNDFIRGCTGFLIGYSEVMIAIFTSPEIKNALNKTNKELKTELDKVPPTKAKLRGKINIFEKAVLPKFEKEFNKAEKYIKPFAQKRKAGRPKRPKRKRGDRKNLGYEK